MIVRIDTTNITRGREFTLYAKNPNDLDVIVKALKPSTGEVTDIEMEHGVAGEFEAYRGIAPSLDGYLMAEIGRQKVVKKIGMPTPAFVLGYRENYTVGFKTYDVDGVLISDGNLIPVGSGFYYTLIPQNTVVVRCLNRNFLVNKNLLKMNYKIEISGGELNSTIDNPVIDNVSLPDIELQDVELGDSTLGSTMPNITIEEL